MANIIKCFPRFDDLVRFNPFANMEDRFKSFGLFPLFNKIETATIIEFDPAKAPARASGRPSLKRSFPLNKLVSEMLNLSCTNAPCASTAKLPLPIENLRVRATK